MQGSTGASVLVGEFLANEHKINLKFAKPANESDPQYLVNGFKINQHEIYRIGEYESKLCADGLLAQIYNHFSIMERHRHKIEFDETIINNQFVVWLNDKC